MGRGLSRSHSLSTVEDMLVERISAHEVQGRDRLCGMRKRGWDREMPSKVRGRIYKFQEKLGMRHL